METTLVLDCGRHSTKYSLISKKHKWSSEVQIKPSAGDPTSSPVTERDWIKSLTTILDGALEENEDLRILFLLQTLCPRRVKESLLLTAFEGCSARKVCMEYVAPAALFSCGETSGMVFDVGYTGVRITPVTRGLPEVDESSNFVGVGSFYAEKVLLSHLSQSDANEERWRRSMLHIMTSIQDNSTASITNKTTETVLPDGTTLDIRIPDSVATEAGKRLLFSTTVNVPDAAWFTAMRIADAESHSHYLRCGGSADWTSFSEGISTALSRSISPNRSSELVSKNATTASVVGGSILSQLSCFKSMCIASEDYYDEGPHGCVRQYATDPR